jgi:thymidylate synthase (FAD)
MKVLDKGSIELVSSMGDDKTIINAARISTFSKPLDKEDDERLMKYLIDNGHTSPFEHVTFTFKVSCPIFIARQWQRHRTWSYNETSRRYTAENIEFFIPEEIRFEKIDDEELAQIRDEHKDKIISIITQTIDTTYKAYKILNRMGVEKGLSRIVLPFALYTEFYASVDLNNLFHFLELRKVKGAQKEIREYASAIETLIEPIVPMAYKYWKEK